jgi:ribosomal protein S18 acetylase RimI-like enzyme
MAAREMTDRGAGDVMLATRPVPEWRRREATALDDDFLFALYVSTRSDLDALGWPEATRAAFCELQWRAQRAGYAATHPDAHSEVLEIDGRPQGRLLTAETDVELVVVDLALLPAAQGHGVGRQVLEALQRAAGSSGRTVRLSVEDANPARRLYERLGFVAGEVHGIHTEMRWHS